MRPFIGSVAACASDAPSGIGTTDAAGTTISSACAPPSGRRGVTRGHDLVAGREPVDALADRLDDAGRVHARDPRRLEALAGAVLAQADVGRVHGGGAHGDADLARPGRAHVAVDDGQDLGAAGGGDRDGTHGRETLTRARLAERADVEIAIAAPGLPGDLDATRTSPWSATAAPRRARGQPPADRRGAGGRAAAAALGIPTIAPGAPAAVLQHAERILDGEDVPLAD